MSLYAHKNSAQSRRDDFESVVFLAMHFLTGSLPWKGLDKKRKSFKDGMMASKSQYDFEVRTQKVCASSIHSLISILLSHFIEILQAIPAANSRVLPAHYAFEIRAKTRLWISPRITSKMPEILGRTVR